MSIYSPDLSLRQPLTLAAILPLLLSYHALAVLTILPNTFVFKLLLLPFILWQAWKCAIEVDFGVPLAQLLGHQGTDRVAFWNFVFVVRFPSKMMPLGGHFTDISGAGFGVQHSIEGN